MPERCGMELCPNWTGDGAVCVCVLLGLGLLPGDERAARTVDDDLGEAPHVQ